MTTVSAARRPGKLSILMIVTSIGASIGISVAMDAVVVRYGVVGLTPGVLMVGVFMYNATSIFESLVGAIIEWRRPGHRIGRLLMLSGPLYAYLALGWMTADLLARLLDPQVFWVYSWALTLVSFPGVALIGGWVPLLFPTGTLPGPRWRAPVALLIVLSGIGLVAWAVRPGPMAPGTDHFSPIVFDAWPPFLQPFVDAVPLELVALIALAIAALITRYRRGDRVARLQIRWFGAAVALCGTGSVLVVIELVVRTVHGPLISNLVFQAGLMLMPIAIGIAVLRYRLFEIDRIISRTIGWAVVTGILGAIFVATIVGLQAILVDVTQAQTLSVAASTLVAFVLFQPLRRRVQSIVDHRFNRARYDAERTAAAFAERQRDQVNIAGLKLDIAGTIDSALSPRTVGIWIRPSGPGGMP
jgi:hypothetical protein